MSMMRLIHSLLLIEKPRLLTGAADQFCCFFRRCSYSSANMTRNFPIGISRDTACLRMRFISCGVNRTVLLRTNFFSAFFGRYFRAFSPGISRNLSIFVLPLRSYTKKDVVLPVFRYTSVLSGLVLTSSALSVSYRLLPVRPFIMHLIQYRYGQCLLQIRFRPIIRDRHRE